MGGNTICPKCSSLYVTCELKSNGITHRVCGRCGATFAEREVNKSETLYGYSIYCEKCREPVPVSYKHGKLCANCEIQRLQAESVTAHNLNRHLRNELIEVTGRLRHYENLVVVNDKATNG